METEAGAASQRPRPWLLALLGIVVVAFVAMRMGGSTAPGAPSSNVARPAGPPAGRIDPALLSVNLEALQEARPAPGDSERNPFRFQPKPPPPAPVETRPAPSQPIDTGPPPPPPPPPVPPIPLKFIGILEAPGVGKIALFTDCRSTYQVAEGKDIAGQYRLVKIGVESVVVEYLDGKGRTTLRMSGAECVGK